MDTIIRQLRYGIRSLSRDRVFAATTVLTLAVCIGANTAMFSIVNSVLLRPLPVADAGSILLMANQYPKAGLAESNNSSGGDYYDRLKAVTALQEQAILRFGNQTVEIEGAPQQVKSMYATPSLFRVLRAAPALGRTFTDDEGEIGNERKVILSDGLWRQLFGGDPAVIGRELRLSGRNFTVIGVMPPNFQFVNPEIRLWTPAALTKEEKTVHHSNNWYHIGRLKPGATMAQVKSQVDAVNAANMEVFPQFKEILINAGFHTTVERLQDNLVKGVKNNLYLLWGGAAFVLLIGSVNIANLALARVNLRTKELATRLALGAGSAQITGQMIVEHLLLAAAGGAAGLAAGAGILQALRRIGLDRLPRANEIQIDSTVVGAALAMSVGIGVLLGLLPVRLSGVSLSQVLHEQSRTGTGGRRSRLTRQALVASQIACAFVLLVGSGLLLVSFRQLLRVDPGFDAEGVATAAVSAPRARYQGDAELRALMNRSLEAIRRIPGVTAAGATTSIPFGGTHNDSVILAEGYAMKPGESLISPLQFTISPGYMEAMKIALVRGRYFEERDTEKSPPVVIVDERLARKFWSGQDPVGKRMYMPGDAGDLLKIDANTHWLKVVGVVKTVRAEDLAGNDSPVGAYYFPYAQSPSRGFTFAVRTAGASAAINGALRAAIGGIDRELAIFDLHTMAERAELSLASRKTSMMLALGCGGLALFLSAVGIYGVLAYFVTQRKREMGIRIALGSTQGGIFRLVVREGLALVAIGVIVGLAGAAVLRSAVESQIYGVHALDPAVIAIVVGTLATVALAACLLPARRAMRVDPLIMLNQQ